MTQPILDLLPIDIGAYRLGNTGIDYVHKFESNQPGPNVLINALTHGNEVCGAHALAIFFENDIRPIRGSLTLSFSNVDAYHSFDEKNPTASRFIHEDFNRVWADEILNGDRQSSELKRAREILPVISEADFLLDIHSMQLPSPALTLCGTNSRGRELAIAMGLPEFVVSDPGHKAGPRMRDYKKFAQPNATQTALLIECGQHWLKKTAQTAINAAFHFLYALGIVDKNIVAPYLGKNLKHQRQIEVVGPITIQTNNFTFLQSYNGMEIISNAGTIIGYDDGLPILTPHDNCILIMPTHKPVIGHTGVRLGRFID